MTRSTIVMLATLSVLLCGSLAMPQANDACVNASVVVDGTTAFDTTGAITDGPDDCSSLGADIWFKYTASCTGPLIVDTVGSSFDTTIAAYNTFACAPVGSQLGCNDDDPGVQSRISFAVTSGQEILFRVGGDASDTGTGFLNIVCGAPPNDECANAAVITTASYSHIIDTSNATSAVDDPDYGDLSCTGGVPATQSKSVWYIFQSVDSAQITIDTCASAYDTVLAVFDATSGCPVTAVEREFCNDEACGPGVGHQSQVTFTSTAGTHYLIEVMAHGSSVGGSMILNFQSAGSVPVELMRLEMD